MKCISRKVVQGAAAAAIATLCVGWPVNPAHASLTNSYQFNGKGNWSLNGVGSNNTPVGSISEIVPTGSTIQKAFLYSSTYGGIGTPTVGFDGTILGPADFTPLGITANLEAFRADVTSQVSAKIGSGSASPFSFSIDSENPNGNVDGEALAIVYSNPAESVRTIALLDGFSATTGDTTNFNFATPLGDPTAPGFEALMSLGIGFGFQPAGQWSQVDVNGRRLTSSAGGQDDGQGYNGGLITIGGIGDDPANPVDPFVNDAGGPRTDDELYNLALGNGVDPTPFLHTGDTTFKVDTLNPSNNDNIFFLGLNVTAEGGVNQPPPSPSQDPEPCSLALLGIGAVGLAAKRRNRKQS